MRASEKNCLVGLMVIVTVVGATQLHFLLLQVRTGSHPCEQVKGVAIIRDESDCSRFIMCIAGNGLDLPPCVTGHVWSIKMARCVLATSPWNDCPDNVVNGTSTPIAVSSPTPNATRTSRVVFTPAPNATRTSRVVFTPAPNATRTSRVVFTPAPNATRTSRVVFTPAPNTTKTSRAVPTSAPTHKNTEETFPIKVAMVTDGQEGAWLDRTEAEFNGSDWSSVKHETYSSKVIKSYVPHHPCTFDHHQNNKSTIILPHPKACHMYYNCSVSTEDRSWIGVGGSMETPELESLTRVECPYPKLFSPTKESCLHYTQVDCGDRPEYKTPCDYSINCGKEDCSKCPTRLAGCVGLRDGPHPFPSRVWSPWYIVCKDERTLEQTTCRPPTPLFSPYTRKCVTSAWVPKQYGGEQPLCYGRPDGFHPDERGSCSDFFQCKNGNFLDYFTCNPGLFFDPETSTCSSAPRIPPCGNQISSDILQGFCKNLKDGFHADPYGRCSLYIECRERKLKAYLKCLTGTFDPERKICGASYSSTAPCGFQPNHCTSKLDGVYASPTCCRSMVTCRRRYVSSIDECPHDEVFDGRAKSCRNSTSTSLSYRCGGMLGCRGGKAGS